MPLTIISFIALIINVIILFVVILCKQVRKTKILSLTYKKYEDLKLNMTHKQNCS